MNQLHDTPWPLIPQRPIVLVPLGSCEQHGPHLPFTTDTDIAQAAAVAAAPRIEHATGNPVVLAPALPYGASGEHQGFPGTISIGHDALRTLLVELIRSVSTWAERIVLVNGHGGNALTVKAVVDQMTYEQHTVIAINCAFETNTDAHAGHDETSVMLHLRPDSVASDNIAVGTTAPLQELLPELMASGVRPVAPTGVLGDPTTATSEIGEAAFASLVERIIKEASND